METLYTITLIGVLIALAGNSMFSVVFMIKALLGGSQYSLQKGVPFYRGQHISEGGGTEEWIFPLVDPEERVSFIPQTKDIIEISTDRVKRTYVYCRGKLCEGFPTRRDSRERYFSIHPERREKIKALLGVDPVNFKTNA